MIEIENFEDDEFCPGYAGRRQKAAITLIALWGGTLALHLSRWGNAVVLFSTALMGVHVLRVLFARPRQTPPPLSGYETYKTGTLRQTDADPWPYISLLVAAKNEEAVIESLVNSLFRLDYPRDRYDLWIINDNSSDSTGTVLDRLAQQYQQLHVVHRGAEAKGGKSGALNLVWPQTDGDLVAVFDADAQVPVDLMRRTVPMFSYAQTVGAVQVRKAIANSSTNFLTRCQQVEMALDSYFQQQRIALGGIGELRGNGQFVRRSALVTCGGWNEETITDDLDLTVRLHLSGWEIDFLAFPSVKEEGVTRPSALWHQRNRWAEGGYQRYLDYWRLIGQNRMGLEKTLDMLAFWVMQYMLPVVTPADLLVATLRHRSPIFAPLTALAVMLSMIGMFVGLRRIQKASVLMTLIRSLRGTVYMLHWLPVIASTTIRISVRPKRLKWVKTVHQGDPHDEFPLDVSA
ncbi:MAG: glycosyltransferase family 2 protein [Leptolyngbyaceae cyanobacterium SL_1_1]|nr:glycosyltransferase family 2 protein [Leptolyngbyaceae cyanobacterium RM1_1_2]NJO09163.1 glycosyltransferase family 2 protein [Leptolyngbyaceae cyanobacterium SL_1_1]